MISFDGRSLLVVGGGSGIGRSAAVEAAGLGAHVTIADVELPKDLGPAIRITEGDATNPQDMARCMQEAAEQTGSLNAVLTTVGGAHLGPVDEMDIDAWRAELEFNLTSAFVVCQAAVTRMRAQGYGAIVTTSSGYADLPGPDRIGYSAAKSGVIALSRSMAMAGAADGIRVNCIAPGPTDSARFRAMNGGDAGVERVRQAMPLGTIPQPIEVARAALFLLSSAASQVTGQVLHVNGGILMR